LPNVDDADAKDRKDFTIYSGNWAIGCIYEQRGGPDSMRWFWSLHGIFGKATMLVGRCPQ
jgi:hypothetical protein